MSSNLIVIILSYTVKVCVFQWHSVSEADTETRGFHKIPTKTETNFWTWKPTQQYHVYD